MFAFGQLVRLFAAGQRDRPDRSRIAFSFVVNCYADERNPRSIRRHLRIAGPDKVPQIFFGNVALLSERSPGAKNANQQEYDNGAHRLTILRSAATSCQAQRCISNVGGTLASRLRH